jgi:hypothetical protein
MADEIHGFVVTIPAGTPMNNLYVAKLPLNLYSVTQIDLNVPPGPSLVMGFYLALSGQQWIPWEAGTFIVRDNWEKEYPLTNQPTSSGWELHGYNLGVYNHSVNVTFHLDAVASPNTSPVAPTLNITTQPVSSGTSIL